VLVRTHLLCLLLAAIVSAAQEPQAPEVARARPAIATVWTAREDRALDRLIENPAVTKRMVDGLVLAATGERDIRRAWRRLVSPQDRVGIKVNAAAGATFSTRAGVVRAIVAGLRESGMPAKNIIVWDRDSLELRDAGFDPKMLGCAVRGIDPPRGWDRSATFIAPTLGRLIWGDALFLEKTLPALGRPSSDADQLSSNSHFPTLLTRGLTRVINVATLTDNAGCGVGGVFYNLCVRSVDNWRRFVATDLSAADSIPDIYMSEHVQPKIALHILDGLIAQYAGGPSAQPNYAFQHATLYASRDPVALDATAGRRIDAWRREAKLPPIARRLEWLKTAESMGIGEADESRIRLVPAPPPP
jgi:hypothetical protein